MTRAFEVSRAHYIVVAGHCTCSVTDKCATYLALQDLYDAGRRSGIEVSAMANAQRADKAEAALKVAVEALEMASAFCSYVEQEEWVEPSETGFWVETWNLRDAAKDALATICKETSDAE